MLVFHHLKIPSYAGVHVGSSLSQYFEHLDNGLELVQPQCSASLKKLLFQNILKQSILCIIHRDGRVPYKIVINIRPEGVFARS